MADAREYVERFCRDSVELLRQHGVHPKEYKGLSPFNDPSKNKPFESLASYTDAAEAIRNLAHFRERFGETSAEHFALQVLYNYLGILDAPTLDDGKFDGTWKSLLEELANPEWTFIGICNLQNFKSKDPVLELGDGITVRTRSYADLSAILGWSEEHIDATLGRDWSEGSFGSHVLLIETKLAKSAENLTLVNDAALLPKFVRILLALRLLKEGFVRPGRLFFARPARFVFGLQGISSSGYSRWQPGTEYSVSVAEVPEVRNLYNALVTVESLGESAGPFALALRSFNTIYDREHFRAEDRLVDSITAIEACLRLDTDLSFRSSFQVAGILANADDERVQIYGSMRGFYDTRSKLVHGGELKQKHRTALANHEQLIGFVRRLLRGFVTLTCGGGVAPEFYRELDASLQHAARRTAIRAAMGLT